MNTYNKNQVILMTIFYLPIEQYETRYTAQWYIWFKDYFKKNKIDYKYIIGDTLTENIESGSVLDAEGTNNYKFSQLQKLCELFKNHEINDGDSIFLADGWFPGIEGIQYIIDIKKLNVKIYSIFHAGTYDPYDFTVKAGMRRWGGQLEQSWFNIYDKIFVATEFHKNMIIYNRDPRCEVVVTGLPINMEIKKYISDEKEDIVVFPHRLDDEKQPHLFDRLKERINDKNVEFIKTMEHNLSKVEYYKLLGKSKVGISYARQETFGYGLIEAALLGCSVLAPNQLSYQEIFSRGSLFNLFDESADLTARILKGTYKPEKFNSDKYSHENTIGKMIKEILGVNNL